MCICVRICVCQCVYANVSACVFVCICVRACFCLSHTEACNNSITTLVTDCCRAVRAKTVFITLNAFVERWSTHIQTQYFLTTRLQCFACRANL